MAVDSNETSIRSFLRNLSPVDQVGAEARASMLSTRSIKTASKLWAIDAAISMIDLTTLEGADTPGKVISICAKAIRPDPTNLEVPHVGAVCVYNDMVKVARQFLDSSGGEQIPVAAVSTAFPSGRASIEVKQRDTEDAIANGATEIDMVIDRGAFLSGNLSKVLTEIVCIKEICGDRAHLKVILETGELVTYDNVRKASFLAMAAGADFIKTSTGKVQPAATPAVVLVMLEAVRDYYQLTGKKIGVKPAGGIRTTKDAIKQLVLVNETAGPEWLSPALFRIGASALLNDLLMQRMKMKSGQYSGRNYVSLD
ncbi:MAG: 2-deoxyribose-5-phosphate aldolase [Actinobacteria bacterium BACL2 MAG-121001-bin67]|uniref:Deoxyribose-phosphate aldolase n=4 Tax=ac1 cluster TaxID=1655545 RepID=A0A0R2P3I7_9ACTN|nr:MAG: 2-deoxyribose-5-phosphate aldolase [Actinobacteria bacterium BACL2 MAG-121001-bin67]KRO45191.1 MAG: 2-deoxyribose-5-phosphate aldolase [Actinobacteria bacterium BACL2 MAG-120813-bin23]KRO54195.1 MAG: 2-deoxyribose-5-phosphate aldolase [Actinobacteria bacterium BACL2 MAG-120820-bin50]KRO74667.1 MAG: 2-deoxyribose-5-phosphate aldolase [Actinobacteria bacterium BACL2 MAG-120920-bin34]KRP31029.1 MAG: 2-deoxyribose-5-phosphate aldolase [Actinobacteria bacterium BACL2 MAG-120507-bin38]HCP722